MERWERVYTINGYFDGPRLGVADFQGRPHIFQSRFDVVKDDWSDEYQLVEIDPDLLRLVLEDWQIWLRWQTAFKGGKIGIETHPALPAERARHDELQNEIGDRLERPAGVSKTARAVFRGFHLDGECGDVLWYV
jgi:hypothetical protein